MDTRAGGELSKRLQLPIASKSVLLLRRRPASLNGVTTMDRYQISPRVAVDRGDAVKVHGKRGKFRFVAYDPETELVHVVGPVGGAELTRTFAAGLLRSAGRTPRSEVAMSFEARELSRKAQSWRR